MSICWSRQTRMQQSSNVIAVSAEKISIELNGDFKIKSWSNHGFGELWQP